MIDINGLKEINDTKGHEKGDFLIRGTAQCIEKTLTKDGYCFFVNRVCFVTTPIFRQRPE